MAKKIRFPMKIETESLKTGSMRVKSRELGAGLAEKYGG